MLYNLPKEVDQALENYLSCFDENGEVVGDYETAQKSLLDLQNKQLEGLEWCLTTIRESELRQEAINSEITRLKNLCESEERRSTKLTELAERLFTPIYEGKPATVGNFKLSFRKSERVETTDELPEEYLARTETVRVNKIKIKEDLKLGKEIKGATLQTYNSFQIK